MYCKPNNCIQNILPETSSHFKEELMDEILTIPPQKPDIERVLDVIVWPEVMDMKLVETEVGRSNEGQNLTGVKLVVELNIKEKVTYVACDPTQSVHAAHFETYKSMFVILPEKIGDKYTCELVRSGRINVTPYVESSNARQLDCRNIYRCLMLFLDVKIC